MHSEFYNPHALARFYGLGDVFRVHDKMRVLDDERDFEALVVHEHDHAVLFLQKLGRESLGLHFAETAFDAEVFAAVADRGDVGVVVRNVGALEVKLVDDFDGGRVARVVDVLFEGDAEREDFCAAYALAVLVERVGDFRDHVARHAQVDLRGQLDELGVEVEFACLPREVVGVDRDAVAADAGAGVERHVTERFRRRRVDDLPDVDLHAIAQERQFVDERDVDAAENVFEQLGHLGDSWVGHLDDELLGDDLRVEVLCELRALLLDSADDFWGVANREVLVARVNALR